MNSQESLSALSPVDGRYHARTAELRTYFSEFALIRYRLMVESEYLLSLISLRLKGMPDPAQGFTKWIRKCVREFTTEDALAVKSLEKKTNHDIKALEYFIREKLEGTRYAACATWVHFGLTSQDINNTALPLMLRDAHLEVFHPQWIGLLQQLNHLAMIWKKIPMLARTHGQPASPTMLGKEIKVFAERLEMQLANLSRIPFSAKFGGATGNMNAHYAAYPGHDWQAFATAFIRRLGLQRQQVTTQIEHYDDLAAWFDGIRRINTLLTDLCRDLWMYVSFGYFRLKRKEGEVGSSAMPHKVNPIDFENAEGNFGIANALLAHFSEKLPMSRLQRDLTDSTVTRNFGTALAHTLIALKSLEMGLLKLEVNEIAIQRDLDENWQVLAEAIQTIMKREGREDAYEQLRDLTRTGMACNKKQMHELIDTLDLPVSVKKELKKLSPSGYTGKVNYQT